MRGKVSGIYVNYLFRSRFLRHLLQIVPSFILDDTVNQSSVEFGRHAVSGREPRGTDVESWEHATPADLIRGIMARLPSVVFSTLLVTAVSVGILVAWPNQYSSDGLMYVRLGRAALSVDPIAQNSGSDGVSVQETRSSEVLSIAEMIGSREIAERVVEKVGAEIVNQPRTWLDRAQIHLGQLLPQRQVSPPGQFSVDQYETQIDLEDAIKKVRRWLSVNAPKNGYTVAIEAKGPDALLVHAIAQAVMDEYKRYHVEAHRTDGSMEFFEQQVGQSRTAAVEAREGLQKARSVAGWMSIPSAESTLRDRIVNLEVSLDEAQSKYAESSQRAVALKGQLAQTKEWIPTEITKGVANVASDAMRTQLFGEQVEESEQLATLKPTHPRFRLLKEKMSRSSEIVTEEDANRELTLEAINPIWQQLESAFSLASADAQGLGSKCESLQESLGKARSDLQRLNHDAVTLARLKWQADIAEETLKGHARSLEEARIIFELDQKNMSDVTIVQDASLNLKKVGPPRALLTMVGGLLGLGIGVLQALLRQTPPIKSHLLRSKERYAMSGASLGNEQEQRLQQAVGADASDVDCESNIQETEVVGTAHVGTVPVSAARASAARGKVLPR